MGIKKEIGGKKARKVGREVAVVKRAGGSCAVRMRILQEIIGKRWREVSNEIRN